jgi:FAS-associated factor 2
MLTPEQIAITKFFDGEQADPVAEAIAAQAAAPTRSSRQENLQESLLREASPYARSAGRVDAAPRIVPQRDDQIVHRPPFLLALLFSPFNLIYKILSSSFGLFAYLFPFLPRLFQPRVASPSSRMRNTTGRRQLNPRDTAARFKREFEEEYGPHSLPFFDNGYAQALDLAKKDLKFLLIVLASPEHDDTAAFTQDTLLSPEVVAFINDPANNIIVWAGNVQDSEAYQVSTALRCTKFPFSCLISHTPSQGSTSMSTIARLPGPMPASAYIAKLRSAIATYSEQLAAVRSARSAQAFDRSIRQEQDSAYERSLRQDQERARQRREAEAAAALAEKQAAEEAAAAEEYAAKLQQWKEWRARSIAPEPTLDVKETVRIGLRFPDTAERVTRKFRADTDIEELYAFVECYETLQETLPATGASKPENFKHIYGFRLVSPMPRTVYDLELGGTIGERVGRSGNLIVEPIVEEEDDGDDED